MIGKFVNAPFIVLGYHRSGTSLLAGLLDACGINMGQQMFPATPSNKKGHFEEINILNFHRKMMQKICSSDGGIERTPLRENLELCWSYSEAIEAVHLGFPHLKTKEPEDIPWGWKDPRTLVFIRLWLQLFPEARLIVAIRHPSLVAESLKKRDGWDTTTVFRSWYRFHTDVLDLLHGTRYVLFTYNRLVDEPTLVPEFFSKKVGSGDMLDFEPYENAYKKCNAFSDPSLMHCKTENAVLTSDVMHMWSILQRKATMYI